MGPGEVFRPISLGGKTVVFCSQNGLEMGRGSLIVPRGSPQHVLVTNEGTEAA